MREWVKDDSKEVFMKSATMLSALFLSTLMVAPASFAMTARECVSVHSELSKEQASLSEDYAELQALAEEAELVGDEYVDAKEMSGLQTPELIARAEELETQFNELQDEVAAKNASLANRTAAFNAQRASFQTGCQAYFAQN